MIVFERKSAFIISQYSFPFAGVATALSVRSNAFCVVYSLFFPLVLAIMPALGVADMLKSD
ncbi:MAG: hypothetical protein LBQ64_04075, partial [Bacteroidales bacterium]|nr:hypothetical protein [Bacteroidales bacterium]